MIQVSVPSRGLFLFLPGDVILVRFNLSSIKSDAYTNKEGENAASTKATGLGFKLIATAVENGNGASEPVADPAEEQGVPF
jgi:hypothetical protein